MIEQPGRIALFPGVEELLARLARAGRVVSIVSSNSEGNIRTILGDQNSGLIHIYECGASLFGKARRFRRVLKRTGLQPSEGICIGDEIRDIEAARKEGIGFGAVSWGYTHVDALRQTAPDIVFSSPAEIGHFLLPD
jgi:phosphoglycolate phosphatase